MPMKYSPPDKEADSVLYEFWITSSRGTNKKASFYLPASMKKEDIQYELEEWCSQFGCWDSSENVVHYGYK